MVLWSWSDIVNLSTKVCIAFPFRNYYIVNPSTKNCIVILSTESYIVSISTEDYIVILSTDDCIAIPSTEECIAYGSQCNFVLRMNHNAILCRWNITM